MVPIVNETLLKYAAPNIDVCCSKSGKLSRYLVEYYYKTTYAPLVTEDFVLVIDA